MKQTSIKYLILDYLYEKNRFVYGGIIEDYIRTIRGAKASNASRRCRELYNDGLILRKFEIVNGNKVVLYKYKYPLVKKNNLICQTILSELQKK